MDIERIIRTGEKKITLVEQLRTQDWALTLNYLSEGEKQPLVGEYPMVDFKQAAVAKLVLGDGGDAPVLRHFLRGFAELESEIGILLKSVRCPFLEGQGEDGVKFWVIFVHQVRGDKLANDNISYLSDLEIRMWERAVASHLQHFAGGVTVIRG